MTFCHEIYDFILTVLECVLLADDSLLSCHQQSLWKFFFPSRSLLNTPKPGTDCQGTLLEIHSLKDPHLVIF